MRVLVVNRYWRDFGGTEQCVRDLVAELEVRGHEVVPFAMAGDANWPTPYERYFPSAVDPAGGIGGRMRAAARAIAGREARRCLRRLLDDVEVDVAHVFNAYHHLGSLSLLELPRRGVPAVWSLHDYKVACPNVVCFSERTNELCTVCLDRRFAYAWAPPVLRCRGGSVGAGIVLSAEATVTRAAGVVRRVPTVVTVLHDGQRRAAEHAGVDASRIHTVKNFVDLGAVSEAPRGDHVLFVGRLVPGKGVDTLVRAAALGGLAVRVLGDGPRRADLEALAAAAGADVTFLGHGSRDDVVSEMAAAAVLAVPSHLPESQPVVVTEAWSTGLPVVGTALGGLAELLADGRGWTCPPGDAGALAAVLGAVVDDPELGRRATDRARAYAELELGRATWVERMRHVYAAAGVTL